MPPEAGASRFWFYPLPLGQNSVHVSDSARTILFDTGLQVLTESQRVQHGLLTDSGQHDELAQEAARQFTANLANFKPAEFVTPHGVFTRLHGLLDVVTAARMLRAAGVDYAVLHQMAALPYRKLVGSEAVPGYYRGIRVERSSGNWELFVTGGVHLHARPSARAVDRYRDSVPAALEALADRLPSRTVVQPIGFSFTTAGADARTSALEQALRTGARALAAREYQTARARFAEATTTDPLDAEAWSQLALALSGLGRHSEARASAQRAAQLEPADPVYRLLALDMEWQSDPGGVLERTPESARRMLSEEYVEAARLALGRDRSEQARRLAERATRLWDRNGEAYLLRAAARPPGDLSGRRLDTARAVRAYRQILAERDSAEVRQRLALALSQSAMQRLLRVTGVITSAVQRGDEMFDGQEANVDLDAATQEAQEAHRLDPQVPLAPAVEVTARVMRAEVLRSADLRADLSALRVRADEVVKRYPDFPLAYVARAMVKLSDGEAGEALADADRSIALHPGFGLGHLTRAMIHDELGDCEAAVADRQEARKLRVPLSPLDAKAFTCPASGGFRAPPPSQDQISLVRRDAHL